MKKSYKTIKFCVAAFSLAAASMSAQLSGLYTINSGAPASSSNYTSFSTFASDLNSLGVNGAVTVNVVSNSGPYTEQVTFNQATGISATNSVLINGNGNTLTFASSTSGQPYTLLFNGADYMSVKDLTVNATGTYGYATMLVGGADNNKLDNCTFNCPVNTTSSNHIPVVFSGSSSNYYTSSNSGNNNLFNNCTLKYGYFSVVHYGLTGSPYNSGNSFVGCKMQDWYYYGVYSYYAKNLTVSGCTVERPTNSSVGFAYGFYLYYNQGAMINGNRIQKFWGASPGNTNGTYAIYTYYNPLSGAGVQQNRIQNNIFSDFTNNSYIYCIYSYYQNGFIEHNTFVLNNPNNTYTGTYYNVYGYAGGTTYPLTFRNNLIYITNGGSGQKYGVYYPTTSGVTSNYNNYYVNVAGGTGYVAYYAGAHTTTTSLASAGSDANSISQDPAFISPSAGNYMPSSYQANDLGTPVGITTDIFNSNRSATVPDIGAIEFLNTPCSGAPSANSIVTPTVVQCPGVSIPLSFSNAYTLTGMTFQWQSSTTSSVGPFTSVSGGTNQALNTPTLGQSTWYTAIVTCTNGNQSTSAVAGQVMIAGTTTNTAPYLENFEGISGLNKLPNCSWSASNLPSICQTYTSSTTNNRIARSGTKFASFYYNPGGTNTFYTNGIYLNAGVTYSASVWYTTEYYGYTNWTDLSILVGPNQSTVGLVQVATTGGAAVSPSYKSLSNTFTVATSGLYYVAVRATSSGACCGYYLSWDDLAIDIPCSLNSSAISVNANTTTVCFGQPVTLTASGAGNYLWNNGATTAAITVTPNGNTTYMVTGTNTMTGCQASASQNVVVNPTPLVSIFSPNTSVCKGSSVNLTAFGANNYNWSSGGNSAMVSVSPSVTTTYSVIGVNSFGCVGNASQMITVNNPPSITAGGNNNQMCVGESLTLTATGGLTYTWTSVSSLLTGALVVVSPNVSTTYSVTGTDANGCSSNSTFAVSVNACVGIGEITTTANGVKLYPNPSNGEFTVEFAGDAGKTVEVTDLTGRVILSNTSNNRKVSVNISSLANGIYYVKLQSNKTVEVVKVVKQ